jgi:NhaA family Na+:H+ antiporter
MEKADGGGPFIPDPELHQLQDLRNRARSVLPPLQRLEYQLNDFVAFFVMPLFALANAGIKIGGSGEVFSQPLFVNIAVALLFGKVIGIFLFSWLAVKLRIADLPLRTGWVQMAGLGLLGGIGFTMALFIANLALDAPALLAQAKLGILIGSFVAGTTGYLLLHFTLREPLEEELESVAASGQEQTA